MATIIKHVRVFDGNSFHQNKTILINDGIIAGIDSAIPSDANVIDAAGCTLLPGLIDSHVHTKIPELEIAIKFGVTTELEMMGHQTPQQRQEVSERNDIADLRTAEFGMTAPGGHPYELYKRGPVRGSPPKPEHAQGGPPPHTHAGPPQGMQGTTHPRTATTPSEARDFVAARIADGADYIKIMIEEGSVLEEPGLPLLSQETIEAAVQAAHAGDKIAIAHALTAKATEQAIGAGVDGLAHIFLDGPHTKDLVNAIAKAGTFVTPCICLNASIMGHTGEELAKDERVASKLPKQWLETLRSSFNTYPQGRLEDVLETVGALHKAGVDILVGTDASVPMPALGGLAHGASVHHELQLLVKAGMSPVEALKAATSVPAKRFALSDRGHIEVGKRADLVLVDGDPGTNIADSLSVKSVWKRGTRLGDA